MAISSTTRTASFIGNASTTAFPTGFKFLASGDLTVTVDGATKTAGVDYTVSGAGEDGGGTVTFTAAPANGAVVSITRDTPRLQPVDFRTQGQFAPKVHNDSFDREMAALQDVEAELNTRCSSLESRATADEAKFASLDASIASLAAGLIPSSILKRFALMKASSWTSRTSGTASDLTSVAAHENGQGADVVAAGGPGGGPTLLLHSRDGVNWTAQGSPYTDAAMHAVGYGALPGGAMGFLAFGNSAGSGGVVLKSTDGGLSWATVASAINGTVLAAAFVGPDPLATHRWVRLVWAAPDSVYTIETSPDGAAWTDHTPGLLAVAPRAVAYGAGRYVVVGDGGLLITSDDGLTWTNRGAPLGAMTGVAFGGGVFAAVGSDGSLFSSVDGLTWTSHSSTILGAAAFRAVAYDPEGIFVAVGDNGLVATSPDGAQWMRQPGGTASLYALALSAGVTSPGCWVAVGPAGKILQSLSVPPAP